MDTPKIVSSVESVIGHWVIYNETNDEDHQCPLGMMVERQQIVVYYRKEEGDDDYTDIIDYVVDWEQPPTSPPFAIHTMMIDLDNDQVGATYVVIWEPNWTATKQGMTLPLWDTKEKRKAPKEQ